MYIDITMLALPSDESELLAAPLKPGVVLDVHRLPQDLVVDQQHSATNPSVAAEVLIHCMSRKESTKSKVVARNPMSLLKHDNPMHATERPDNIHLPAAKTLLAIVVAKEGVAVPSCNPSATDLPDGPRLNDSNRVVKQPKAASHWRREASDEAKSMAA